MKTVIVVEQCWYRFNMPDDWVEPEDDDDLKSPESKTRDEKLEEWFCNMGAPYAEAEYFEVSERSFEVEES
jgi:hypothetical protein